MGYSHETNLLPLGYAFAALVLKKLEDRDWLRKRFAMLQDILEDSWAYQEMVAQGLQKGLEQGLQKGLEQGLEKGLEQGLQKGLAEGRLEGELRTLREVIMDVIEERFPQIVGQAYKRVYALEDTTRLRRLNVKISTARTAQEAEQALVTIDQDERKH